ncbi:hypothetical protein BBZ73_07990 [Neisseria gonorrhoeae]|nr:hypothetical protein ACI80_04200 [Neisseria gonorrhoeae]OHZ55862.1 hypothetical protein BBZ67_03655 [Neisseria gonorrhoeae]OHZ56157.1 hypothetical protein BBZ75_04755 [Neisseria gonorrhoeae]OHZ62125.1 hypothetical protein BBZ71_00375 [Neisseria gonorrhoeae]OHZ67787.1 hypothetical protein BBZ81_07130 [Neisseria gonorrhoeae]
MVTDVCLKRKIRNFVEISSENEAGYEIYVKEKSVLNLQNKRAYEALGIESEAKNCRRTKPKPVILPLGCVKTSLTSAPSAP